MTTYIALMRKEPDSDYGVDFPDFPGCITMGATLEEASERAQEALGLHIAGMSEDSETMPAPSTLDTIMADPHHHGAFAFLVTTGPTQARSVRVNVMLPESLVRAIDAVTANRSRFLAEAAGEKLRTSRAPADARLGLAPSSTPLPRMRERAKRG